MRAADKMAATGVASLVLAAGALAAPVSRAATRAPTPRQIAAAVRTATHSRLLWATIDSCGPHGDHTVGIRGQMPALPFATRLEMVVAVQEWSSTAHAYVALGRTWKLGGDLFSGSAVVQNGVRLRWSGQVTLTAKITFEWFRNGKLLASTTRSTTGGHAAADTSGYSVGACSIS